MSSHQGSEVEDFKAHVRVWLDCDADVARLKNELREARAALRGQTEYILAFMRQSDMDDIDILHTKNGFRFSRRVRNVRRPLPMRVIRDRIVAMYAHDPVTARAITDAAFTRDWVERVSLRRTPVQQPVGAADGPPLP